MPFRETKSNIDYVFWLLVFLYVNTGGWLHSSSSIRIWSDILFVAIYFVFFITSGLSGIYKSFKDKRFKKIFYILFIWMLFYFVLYFVIINDINTILSLQPRLVKTRVIYSLVFIPIPVYYFITYRSIKVFFNIFILAAFVIFLLVMLKITTNVNWINSVSFSRGYINVERFLLRGYGMLFLGIFMLIGIFLFPNAFWKNKKKIIVYACIAIYFIYILSLTRRYFVFAIISIFWAFLISNYFGKKLNNRFRKQILSFSGVILIIGSIFFGDHLRGVISGFSTLSLVKDKSYGTTYDRMSLFQHKATLKQFNENKFFGTGYINEWFSTAEEANRGLGLEGGDYIFLSSLAMYGIVGLCLFLPFYFFLYKTILQYLKIIKINYLEIIQNSFLFWPQILLFASTALFFLTHLLTYPMWFAFIGPNGLQKEYYIFTALFFGSVERIRLSLLHNWLIIENS